MAISGNAERAGRGKWTRSENLGGGGKGSEDGDSRRGRAWRFRKFSPLALYIYKRKD